MKNLETHVRIVCMFCGFHNHFTMPVLGEDTTVHHRCEHCDKYIIEMHTADVEE